MNVTLYTAIYGESDWVKPLPPLDAHCILYTDSMVTLEAALKAGWWDVRVVPHYIATLKGKPQITAPMLAHKWWKTHPDLACPPDTDISLWIDGSMELTTDDYVARCLDALGTDDWACVRHPARQCIYPEAEYSATLTWRYDTEAIKAQAAFYRDFHPEGWGLVATGANVRRHTEQVIELGHHWWTECLNWSHQDQLSLPVLLRLAEGKVKWNMNLPWHTDWILHEHGERRSTSDADTGTG
jgi:hypothetical protein